MSAKLIAARVLLGFVALLLVAFYGSELSIKSLVEDPRTLHIGSVPVYNYHLRHRTLYSRSSRKLLDKRTAWVMVLAKNVTKESADVLCGGMLRRNVGCAVKGLGQKQEQQQQPLPGLSFLSVRATFAEVTDVLKRNQQSFSYVEPDGCMAAVQSVASWGLDRIDDRNGLDNSFGVAAGGGSGVHVFVTDTGTRTTHADFGGRAIPTLEVLGNGAVVCDPSNTLCAGDLQGHGTHTAATVGGTSYGVAKGVTLHAVKVLDDSGSGSFSWWAEALNWVAQSNMRPAVISASLGGQGTYQFVTDAVNAAVQAGVTVVVAAGNSNSDACRFSPASSAAAITVGATQSDDSRASYSNYGSCLDTFAPGTSITSAWISSDTASATISGTSMATPHVAGAAALLLEANPSLTPAEVAQALKNQATLNVVKSAGRGSPNILLYVGPVDPTTTTAASLSTTKAAKGRR